MTGISGGRVRATDTFKNGQPCRVMREPDRISRQAGILPSVIKRHISQLQDFHFLVRGVKASGLENKGSRPNKRPNRTKGTMSQEFRKRKMTEESFPPLTSNTICPKRYDFKPQPRTCKGEPTLHKNLLVE